MAASKSDLKNTVEKIFVDKWSTRDGRVVPDLQSITLGNSAVEFDTATVLYADLSGSTKLVDSKKWWFAAEIYKAYLHCAATVIRNQGGAIRSYDGDRIMGLFVGDSQSTSAVKAGLKINYAVKNIINPALKKHYTTSYEVKQVVGIDRSEIRAAKTGVRGDNDIVWVGRAANYAAKLSDLDMAERTWITEEVYDRLHSSVIFQGPSNTNMWNFYKWSQMNNRSIYGSTWTWEIT